MPESALSRRSLLKGTALGLAAPYVRGAYAAGKLSIGFLDHWVPGANSPLTKLCQEWASREKVDIQIDYITGIGEKLLVTIAAEAQSRSGHDILAFPTWWPSAYAEQLEPMDDLMNLLLAENGDVTDAVKYLGRADDHWVAIPATPGSQVKNCCARIDLFNEHVGIDVQKMYPAGGEPDTALADNWTWNTFLSAARKAANAGYPFGMPLGTTSDAVDWVGTVFAAYGAQLFNAKGDITVRSDNTRQALEYLTRLVAHLPPEVFAWDDTGNNKWLISGRGALIMNPPSAWAVAKRDNIKIAEQCWSFDAPKGPNGRYVPGLVFYWGVWNFSGNKPAAKSLLSFLSTRSSIEQLVDASGGYDLPSFSKMRDFKVWAEQGPPKGTLYNYPPKHDQIVSIACAPAPPKVAHQAYTQATLTKMVARCTQQGQSIEKTVAWAENELEGFRRT